MSIPNEPFTAVIREVPLDEYDLAQGQWANEVRPYAQDGRLGTPPVVYLISILDAAGRAWVKPVEAIVVGQRIGVAWESDVSWATLSSTVEEAIDCWLNREDEWQRRQ